MCKKYAEVVDEYRKLQVSLKQSEKKIIMIQREKEQLQTERSKAILTRSRLENLCRELQKQNKAVKEEGLLKVREEEEKRKEVSAKFQSTVGEITALLRESNEKNIKMYEDNLELSKKFKSIGEQFALREQQVTKMLQQMQFQTQLAEAGYAKIKMEMAEEKEALLKEKQRLLLNLTEYQVRIRELQATEVDLRSQISIYTDKYDEFQNALTRSNEVYGGFNEEMEKMSKKILKLEEETTLWKQRWENSHAALLEMVADKRMKDTELASLSKKLVFLQELCRALQRERTSLLIQLGEKMTNTGSELPKEASTEENVITIKPTHDLSKDFEQMKDGIEQATTEEDIQQVDDLTKDCQQLTEEIEHIQGCLSEEMKKVIDQDSKNLVEKLMAASGSAVREEQEPAGVAGKTENCTNSKPSSPGPAKKGKDGKKKKK
ncbi:alpha-taxilin isoform X2 [Orussus abietinus]|nr:alpha-taxilin isoform X2 [Orussus abietinus]XP_012280715.1 alpha-taxilin isoform X2 [Orussus abietinus]XP_012280716.1 alpha-taxilin isoform X2 [Orussus abietinus]